MYICCSTRTLSEEQVNYASIILRIVGQLQSIIGNLYFCRGPADERATLTSSRAQPREVEGGVAFEVLAGSSHQRPVNHLEFLYCNPQPADRLRALADLLCTRILKLYRSQDLVT